MHHHLFYQIYGKGTPISLPQLDLLPFYDLSFDTFLTFFKVDSNLFFDFLISNVTKYAMAKCIYIAYMVGISSIVSCIKTKTMQAKGGIRGMHLHE